MPDIDEKLAGLAREANQAHAQAQDFFKRGAEHAMVAGKALLKAKAKLKHGAWGPWLARNFEGSERTAQLYMRLAKHIRDLDGETRNAVAELSLREAAQTIATPRVIHVTKQEVETRPVRITVTPAEPEPFVPSPPGARRAQDAAPARLETDTPSTSRRSDAPEAAEAEPIASESATAPHVEALLACMRSMKPAEFARGVAHDAICDAADLEELASWLSDAASEISRFGTRSRTGT